jgi:hypothetical protein
MKQIFEGLTVLAAIMLYLMPAMKADALEHPDAFAITVANILLGWTVIGWVAALAWARRPRAGQPKRLPHLARRVSRSVARVTIGKLVARAASRTRLAA